MLGRWLAGLVSLAAALLLPAAASATDRPAPLPFERAACTASAPPGWTGLRAPGAAMLAPLDPGWRLLVDQTRFERLRITVRHTSGSWSTERGNAELGDVIGVGNHLSFTIPVAGARVREICLDFEGIDDPALVRSLKAASPAADAALRIDWLVLSAVVLGVLGCALVYNLFLMLWLSQRFQRWYIVWLAAGMGYTAIWSGVAALHAPVLAGAVGIRINLVLVSILVGSAVGFFFDFIEPRAVPPWLRRAGRYTAALVPVLGLAAAADPLLPAPTTDLLLNLGFIAGMGCTAAGVLFAIPRGSRSVWFYLAGWLPALSVFGLRVARNFGALPQSDAVDQATFVAVAFEAMVLSLAIADRFRALRRDRDVAEGEAEMLRRVATTDPMTGLPNRSAFQERLAAIGAEAMGADLMLIDLDDLKQTNDTAGHDAGDALLAEAGRRLQRAAGPDGLVARLGGDEFAVLLAGDARAALPAICALIEQSRATPFFYRDRRISVAMSGGLVHWTPADGPIDRTYKRADLALYRAKADGRGCWRAYSADMCDEQESRRAWAQALREGLEWEELILHYQPILNLRSGETVYYEALLRWEHPELGLLAPPAFATAFDEPDVAVAVQDFVLARALDRVAAARRSGGALQAISVNFLACQLQGRDAAIHILDLLARRGLPPAALIVEVTETVVLGRPGGPVVECLTVLQAEGVGIALDDFGTGYASLVHLRELPADVLKIDRSFVSGVPGDVESTKIVRAIVALAHSLGRKVIAEGVETEAQRDYLRRLGCDFGQGYLFGRPARIPGAAEGEQSAGMAA